MAYNITKVEERDVGFEITSIEFVYWMDQTVDNPYRMGIVVVGPNNITSQGMVESAALAMDMGNEDLQKALDSMSGSKQA